MIYPYGHSPLPALLHAVIEKINQWKIDLPSMYYCLCGTQVHSNRNLKKKYKKHTTMTWHKLVRKIALNEQLTRKTLCIIYEKLLAAMKFCDSSIGLVILVAITEATKCSHPSPCIAMRKYVNKKKWYRFLWLSSTHGWTLQPGPCCRVHQWVLDLSTYCNATQDMSGDGVPV